MSHCVSKHVIYISTFFAVIFERPDPLEKTVRLLGCFFILRDLLEQTCIREGLLVLLECSKLHVNRWTLYSHRSLNLRPHLPPVHCRAAHIVLLHLIACSEVNQSDLMTPEVQQIVAVNCHVETDLEQGCPH